MSKLNYYPDDDHHWYDCINVDLVAVILLVCFIVALSWGIVSGVFPSCPHCGYDNHIQSAYCTHCGKQLRITDNTLNNEQNP